MENGSGLEAVGEGGSSSTVSFIHGFDRMAASQSANATINAVSRIDAEQSGSVMSVCLDLVVQTNP